MTHRGTFYSPFTNSISLHFIFLELNLFSYRGLRTNNGNGLPKEFIELRRASVVVIQSNMSNMWKIVSLLPEHTSTGEMLRPSCELLGPFYTGLSRPYVHFLLPLCVSLGMPSSQYDGTYLVWLWSNSASEVGQKLSFLFFLLALTPASLSSL